MSHECKGKSCSYHCEAVPSEIMNERKQYISYLWEFRSEHYNKSRDAVIKYLFVLATGGISLVSYLVQNSTIKKIDKGEIKLSLIFFVFGLILLGIHKAIDLHGDHKRMTNSQEQIKAYYQCKTPYERVGEERESKLDLLMWILGYSSALSSGLGIFYALNGLSLV